MKKYLIFLLLLSCTDRETIINKRSREIFQSSLEHMNRGKIIANEWDSTMNDLKLTQPEEMDSNYIKLCNNYENIKLEISKLDTSLIIKRYNQKKAIHCDTGLIYSELFDKQIEELELEFIRSFYLLFKKKEEIIKNRKS
jgi:hypothetical protein